MVRTLLLLRRAAHNNISIAVSAGVGSEHLLLLLTPPQLLEELGSWGDFFYRCDVFEGVAHLTEPERNFR